MNAARFPTFSVALSADNPAVRRALRRVRRMLERHRVCEIDCGQVEIVLAEAMNNIVEHAYPERGVGRILLTMSATPTHIIASLRDRGGALPERPSRHSSPYTDLPLRRSDMPEGGFGWLLIEALCEQVDYTRCHGDNRLTLHLRCS